jgi:caa(3)-type oxidase subunit IV
MAESHRKEYIVIFAWLTVLTVVEVGVVYIPGISMGLLISALIGLALVKASLVGLYYMHLKTETNVLRLGVAIPMAIPLFYALVLIAEAAWRLEWTFAL